VAVFVAGLRERAGLLQSHGASEAAATCSTVAGELESSFAQWWAGEVTINDAVVITGYTADHLRQRVRAGSIPHRRVAGSRGEIRIRRCDLPTGRTKDVPNVSIDELANQILSDRK
jgi:hypothetical protein